MLVYLLVVYEDVSRRITELLWIERTLYACVPEQTKPCHN